MDKHKEEVKCLERRAKNELMKVRHIFKLKNVCFEVSMYIPITVMYVL